MPSAILQDLENRPLHNHTTWLRLVHYQNRWLGGRESRADAEDFFLSPQGKYNPREELIATLQSFFAPVPENQQQHSLCRFPARFRWLDWQLNLSSYALPNPACERLERFRAAADAKSAAIVFSSYFLGNPSSTFGHTFLRLIKTSNENKNELLDAGINYAATATSQNALVYAIGGIFGGFRGNFAVMPYFYKVREYNDFEARDLWSYELDLSENEIRQLVDHLWELSQAGFKYYFFDENCSYYMLAAIDAAAPRLNLTGHLRKIWIIPSDTLRALNQEPGFVRQIQFRPSDRYLLQQRLSRLSSEEKQEVYSLAKSPHYQLAKVGDEKLQAEILDAGIALYDFENRSRLADKKVRLDPHRLALLRQRAAISVVSEELKVDPPQEARPDLGHGSSRLGLHAGNHDKNGSLIDVQARFSFHDLLDPTIGFPKNTRIEMGTLTARYFTDSESLRLEDFYFVNLISLNPLTDFSQSSSWRAHIGAKRFYDRNCDECLGGSFEGGYGLGWRFDNFSSTVFLDGALNYSPEFAESSLRLASGPRIHFYYDRIPSWKFQLEAFWRALFFSEIESYYEWNFEARRAFDTDQAINLRFSQRENAREFSLGVYWYL